MTNPTHSPFGPTDSAAQPPQQHPSAAAHGAPLYTGVQAPHASTPQLPPTVAYGYPPVGPNSEKANNGPGLAAFVLGIVSVALAFIPILGFLTFLLGPAGIIAGIVGQKRADGPRRQAVWGTALSAASMALFIALSLVYLWVFTIWATEVGLT